LNTDQAKYQDEMRRIAQIFRIMRILRYSCTDTLFYVDTDTSTHRDTDISTN